MKVRRRFATAGWIALGFVAVAAISPAKAEAGVFNDLMRHFGVGWSDGYHARSAPPSYAIVPLSEPTPPTGSVTVGEPTVARRPVSPAVIEARAQAARRADMLRRAEHERRLSARPTP